MTNSDNTSAKGKLWRAVFTISLLIWLGGKGLYIFSRPYTTFDPTVDNLLGITDVAGVVAIAIALVWFAKKIWGKLVKRS